MTWKVMPCKACGETIELIQINGNYVAYNFEGLGKRGAEHRPVCKNPEYFKGKPEKYVTEAQQKLLRDPWWAK